MMAELEGAIQRLWEGLSQIGAFAFEASNGAGSATDWCGRGEGAVVVTDHHGGGCMPRRVATPRPMAGS